MDEVTERLRAHTGLDVVGCCAFGTGPAQADELLAFVTRGTKRATVGAALEFEALDDPLPAIGQLWGLLDGAGEPRHVAETVDLRAGQLEDVTPAFAWDEGEDDRTLEAWWDGHRTWASQLGLPDAEPFDVIFERFRIVWPEVDRTAWLGEGVREARFDERIVLRRAYERATGNAEVTAATERWEVDALPALVAERDGRLVAALPFRPRPGGEVLTFGVTRFAPEEAVEQRLRRALTGVGDQHGWHRQVDA